MSTIFTDSFACRDGEFEIGEPALGHKGRELCISSGDHEIRVVLTDEQLIALSEQIELADIRWRS